MNLQRSFVWFAALWFAGIGAASAADHAVTVGTATSNVFVPSTLTINAGDTVTFTYGGGMPHNVVSDQAGLFRCAKGCDGVAGGNGAPATGWQDTISFPNAGTFGYYCEAHGSPGIGMAGNIIVNAATPSLNIGGYISGNWFNTSQGGSGFQLEATNATDSATGLPVMLAIWFVYTPDGTGQNWIFAQGDYDPTKSTVTLPAILLGGTAFPPNYVAGNVASTPWGTLTFSFTDCNNGTASWNSTVNGYSSGGPMPIIRLTQIDGTTCPQ
jgi:plastocyanin